MYQEKLTHKSFVLGFRVVPCEWIECKAQLARFVRQKSTAPNTNCSCTSGNHQFSEAHHQFLSGAIELNIVPIVRSTSTLKLSHSSRHCSCTIVCLFYQDGKSESEKQKSNPECNPIGFGWFDLKYHLIASHKNVLINTMERSKRLKRQAIECGVYMTQKTTAMRSFDNFCCFSPLVYFFCMFRSTTRLNTTALLSRIISNWHYSSFSMTWPYC